MYHINCGKESGRNTDAATAEYPDNVLFWRPGENGRYCAIDTDFFIFIGGSTMRNKKGFTLVELVIVIAVIAILAGVMIGTFASVVKKAKESAKMQEMTAQKQEQIANDIDAKLKNAEWLGWEDFETKLADAISKASGDLTADQMKAAVLDAVNTAFAKYAGSIETGNTGLTEEQVKYIVETALSKVSYNGVTESQVKAIINNAVSNISGVSKSQVQAIVDAAQAKNLTLAQVTAVVNSAKDALAENQLTDAQVNAAVTKALKDYKACTLTEEEISAILAKYITNGKANGDFEWYYTGKTEVELGTADQIKALSTLVNGGTDLFKDKTIKLNDDIALTEDWVNLRSFEGTFDGNGKTISGVKFDIVYAGDAAYNGTAAVVGWNSAEDFYGTKAGYGFINELKAGAELKNITIKYAMNDFADDPMNPYTYMGGAVGVLRAGAKVTGVTVTGEINAYGRNGGIVGYADGGEITNCTFKGTLVSKNTSNGNVKHKGTTYYGAAAGVIGFINKDGREVTVTGCHVEGTIKSVFNAIIDGKDKYETSDKASNGNYVNVFTNYADSTAKVKDGGNNTYSNLTLEGYNAYNKDTTTYEWKSGSASTVKFTKK